MRAIVVCDLPDWILADIGQKWAQYCGSQIKIKLLIRHSPGFRRKLARCQARADVVHFLSPWDFMDFRHIVWRPCSFTIWHMVDWAQIDQYQDRWDGISTGSNQWLGILSDRYGLSHDIKRIPYGVDTHKFCLRPTAKTEYLAREGRSVDTIIVGFAGSKWSNESDRKGLDRYFEVARTLRTLLDNPVLFRMVGREWSKNDVPSDLHDVVQVDGFLPTAELPKFYAELDFYLCMSRYEGVPYPVLEAMSSGAVIVSTPVGIVPELLHPWVNGVLVDGKSLVGDASRAIAQLANDLSMMMEFRKSARNTIVTQLEWAEVDISNPLIALFSSARSRYGRRSYKEKLLNYFNARVAAASWL